MLFFDTSNHHCSCIFLCNPIIIWLRREFQLSEQPQTKITSGNGDKRGRVPEMTGDGSNPIRIINFNQRAVQSLSAINNNRDCDDCQVQIAIKSVAANVGVQRKSLSCYFIGDLTSYRFLHTHTHKHSHNLFIV